MNDGHRRRLLIAAGALVAAPLPGIAQQPTAAMPRIGFLGGGDPTAWARRLDAFRAGLRDLGYVEGRNIVIEYRFAEGRYDRLPGLAAELVRLKVDVIVTHSVPGALAAKQATATNPIPVVMTNVGDAVERGIVASLARPGGNITGDTFFAPELAAKRVDVLKDAIPRVRRMAVIVNPDNPGPARHRAMEQAARALDVTLVPVDARGPDALPGAFAAMEKERVDSLVVVEDVALIPASRQIAELALRQRLPSIGFIEYVDAGGLFGYGVNFLALYRRAAFFVDRILKGTKPADIPVERPTSFEYVINMQTAKALGLAVSSATRLRADRLIE